MTPIRKEGGGGGRLIVSVDSCFLSASGDSFVGRLRVKGAIDVLDFAVGILDVTFRLSFLGLLLMTEAGKRPEPR